MPLSYWLPFMIVGGVFILLGIAARLWASREEQHYYDVLSHRPDVREYLEHWPPRIEPAALKFGSWVALAVGVVLLVLGIIFGLRK